MNFLSKTKIVSFQKTNNFRVQSFSSCRTKMEETFEFRSPQMKNFWIPNLLRISRSTTFVLGKSSFEASFERYNLKLKYIWKCPVRFEIQMFLPFLCGNSKNFGHESCSYFENLQLWFWTKIHLSYILEIIFKAD